MTREIPDYVRAGYLPDEIQLHLPGHEEWIDLAVEPLDALYHQIIHWCMVQSWWYYVASNPQVTDEEYDFWRKKIVEWENGHEDLTVGPVLPQAPLGLSPTKHWWNWNASRYPDYIQAAFRDIPLQPYMPQARIQNLKPKGQRDVLVFIPRRKKHDI